MTTTTRRRHLAQRTRDAVRDGARQSAVVLADLIVERFSPDRVVDVGCGEAYLPAALRDRGVEAFGVDGDDVGCDLVVDLARPPYPELQRADVVTCLEVAEHVPAAHAEDLVAWLVELAPVVVFSAAVPHQGGDGHINEQPPGYWADLFARCGYAGSGALRAEVWDDTELEPWYRQNLLVFAAPAVLFRFNLSEDGCPYLVHPVIWELYRR